MHRHTHLARHLSAQTLDILTLLSNHDAWSGSVNGDRRIVCRALNVDTAHRSMLQFLLYEGTHLQIKIQEIRIFIRIRIPGGRPVLHNAEANTDWMYFLAHAVLSLISQIVITVQQQ